MVQLVVTGKEFCPDFLKIALEALLCIGNWNFLPMTCQNRDCFYKLTQRKPHKEFQKCSSLMHYFCPGIISKWRNLIYLFLSSKNPPDCDICPQEDFRCTAHTLRSYEHLVYLLSAKNLITFNGCFPGPGASCSAAVEKASQWGGLPECICSSLPPKHFAPNGAREVLLDSTKVGGDHHLQHLPPQQLVLKGTRCALEIIHSTKTKSSLNLFN